MGFRPKRGGSGKLGLAAQVRTQIGQEAGRSYRHHKLKAVNWSTKTFCHYYKKKKKFTIHTQNTSRSLLRQQEIVQKNINIFLDLGPLSPLWLSDYHRDRALSLVFLAPFLNKRLSDSSHPLPSAQVKVP